MRGICVADDVGGSNLSRLQAVLIYEGLAFACPSFAGYVSVHNMVGWALDKYGSEDQRQRLLPRICRFEALGAYCLSEPASGADAAALVSRAVVQEAGPGGFQHSSWKRELQVYHLVPLKKDGWNNQPTRQVVLEDVRIPKENLLGTTGAGFKIAMSALDGGRLNIAACSLGGARAAIAKATAYTLERKAFASRLADLQALQFRLADMATQVEVAQTFLWRAASALDAKESNASTLCAMAKLHVTDTCFEVANNALQLLGGYG